MNANVFPDFSGVAGLLAAVLRKSCDVIAMARSEPPKGPNSLELMIGQPGTAKKRRRCSGLLALEITGDADVSASTPADGGATLPQR